MKLRKNDFNKSLDEKNVNRKIGLICLKLAKNWEFEKKSDRHSFDKILSLYKLSADYLEKSHLNDNDGNDNQDISIYCQILITIAKYSNIQLLDNKFLDKIISACKNLENHELKGKLFQKNFSILNFPIIFLAKIFSDLSTLMIRLSLEKANFRKAENLLKRAIGLIHSEKRYLQGVIFHNLGALYNRYSQYQKAIQNILKAIDLFNHKNNSSDSVDGNNRINYIDWLKLILIQF